MRNLTERNETFSSGLFATAGIGVSAALVGYHFQSFAVAVAWYLSFICLCVHVTEKTER